MVQTKGFTPRAGNFLRTPEESHQRSAPRGMPPTREKKRRESVSCASRALRGTAPTGHPWPGSARPASMPVVPLRSLRCSAACRGDERQKQSTATSKAKATTQRHAPRGAVLLILQLPLLRTLDPLKRAEHRRPWRTGSEGGEAGCRSLFAAPGMARRKAPSWPRSTGHRIALLFLAIRRSAGGALPLESDPRDSAEWFGEAQRVREAGDTESVGMRDEAAFPTYGAT
eukprot:gene37546-49138_t